MVTNILLNVFIAIGISSIRRLGLSKMDHIKHNSKSLEMRSFLKFWVFFFLLSFVRTIWTESFRNQQYADWLESYDGQFNQLKYTEVAYRGNREQIQMKKRLASANGGGAGFQGNFYYAVGMIPSKASIKIIYLRKHLLEILSISMPDSKGSRRIIHS